MPPRNAITRDGLLGKLAGDKHSKLVIIQAPAGYGKTGTADLLSFTPVLGISIFGQIVISFKGRHHQQEIILRCVWWYVAYSLSAAIRQYNHDENRQVKIRQCKYLNNIAEQDHRFIKRVIHPMLGFKSFWSARATLAEIELWRMLKKGQNKSSLPAWAQFYELAATG
jgi:hypothetical protein